MIPSTVPDDLIFFSSVTIPLSSLILPFSSSSNFVCRLTCCFPFDLSALDEPSNFRTSFVVSITTQHKPSRQNHYHYHLDVPYTRDDDNANSNSNIHTPTPTLKYDDPKMNPPTPNVYTIIPRPTTNPILRQLLNCGVGMR